MMHLWPDAECIHWKRTTNMVLKINKISEDDSQASDKFQFFRGPRGVVLSTQGSKICLKSLSYSF